MLRIFVITSLVVASPLLAQEPVNGEVTKKGKLPSGRTVEKVHWAGTETNYVLISYPKNFDANQTYHINFAFPGTGGAPGPGIEDSNDQYVGILMSYLDQPNITNEQYAQGHWALCRQVEVSLRERVPIKVGQRVVSGVSKGGWISFFMSVEAPQGLDGVCIIAAGRDMHTKKLAKLSHSSMSVLVATGETDPNYPFAQLADSYYKKCGLADYTYEEWLGKGHTSEISPRVQEWLNMVAMHDKPEKEFVKYCESQISKAWKEIKEIPEVLDQYRAVRRLMGSPFMGHVSPEFRAEVASWGRGLSEHDDVAAWLEPYNELRKILKSEMKIYETASVESKHLMKLDAHYRQLAAQTGYADIRRRAAYAHVRNRKVITMLELRKKAREEPAHAALEKKAQELFEQISKLKGEDELLMNHFNRIRKELGEKRGKLQMDSFYQVEWQGKYQVDAEIKPFIESAPSEQGSAAASAAYSGVSY